MIESLSRMRTQKRCSHGLHLSKVTDCRTKESRFWKPWKVPTNFTNNRNVWWHYPWIFMRETKKTLFESFVRGSLLIHSLLLILYFWTTIFSSSVILNIVKKCLLAYLALFLTKMAKTVLFKQSEQLNSWRKQIPNGAKYLFEAFRTKLYIGRQHLCFSIPAKMFV